MNTKERFALTFIAISLLLAGWLDGRDHQMAQQYAASNAGQQLACTACAGGVR